MLTPERQRELERLKAAQAEMMLCFQEHEQLGCLPGEDNPLECCICRKKKIGGKWVGFATVVRGKPAATKPEPLKVQPEEDPEGDDEFEDDEPYEDGSSGQCFCIKDGDGQCYQCRGKILESCKLLIRIFTQLLEGIEKVEADFKEAMDKLIPSLNEHCDGCTNQYADLTVSKLVVGIPVSSDHIFRGIVNGLRQAFIAKGITATPLTDKAWADLCASKGWTP